MDVCYPKFFDVKLVNFTFKAESRSQLLLRLLLSFFSIHYCKHLYRYTHRDSAQNQSSAVSDDSIWGMMDNSARKIFASYAGLLRLFNLDCIVKCFTVCAAGAADGKIQLLLVKSRCLWAAISWPKSGIFGGCTNDEPMDRQCGLQLTGIQNPSTSNRQICANSSSILVLICFNLTGYLGSGPACSFPLWPKIYLKSKLALTSKL